MAMLAEPRRKTKWTLNPRGKLWSEDTNKFGQKLLEKMGWKEGKGLGANEDGMTSHISVQVKGDNSGIGFRGRDTDWCRHQTEFDDVLASLSENMGGGVGGCEPSESLEERSKLSRARLHYKKFTREKDVSKYSKKDLNCILGVPVQDRDESKDEEVCHISAIGVKEDSFGVVTVVGGSIEDYWNRKKTARNANDFDGSENCWGESSGHIKKMEEVKKLDAKAAPDGTPVDAVSGFSGSEGENYKWRGSKMNVEENRDLGESSKSTLSDCGYAMKSSPDSTSDLEGSSQIPAIIDSTGKEKKVKKKKKLHIERENVTGVQDLFPIKSKQHSATIPDSTHDLGRGNNSKGHLNEACPENGGEQYISKKKRNRQSDGEEERLIKKPKASPSQEHLTEENVPDSTTEPKGISQAYMEEEHILSQAKTVDEMLEIMVLGGLSNRGAHNAQSSVKSGKGDKFVCALAAQKKHLYHSKTLASETPELSINANSVAIQAAGSPDIVRKKKKKPKKAMGSKREMTKEDIQKTVLCDSDTCQASQNSGCDVIVVEAPEVVAGESSSGKDQAKQKRERKMNSHSNILQACLTNKDSDEATILASSKLFCGANLDQVKGYGRLD